MTKTKRTKLSMSIEYKSNKLNDYRKFIVITRTLAPGGSFHGQDGWFWMFPVLPKLLSTELLL